MKSGDMKIILRLAQLIITSATSPKLEPDPPAALFMTMRGAGYKFTLVDDCSRETVTMHWELRTFDYEPNW
jgi:hypothetical protein